MSIWTVVCGAIYVNSNEKVLNEFVGGLKKIGDYDGKVEFYVNKIWGHNISMGIDCKKCRYGDSAKKVAKGTYQCDAPNDFECVSASYEDAECVVSIAGNLRGYTVRDIENDIVDILKKFRETFWVRSVVVHMNDEIEEKTITGSDLR